MDRIFDALYDFLAKLGFVPELVPVRVKKQNK